MQHKNHCRIIKCMEEVFRFSIIEQIMLIASGVLFLIQILYYILLYNRIHTRNRASRDGDINFSQEYPPLTVIICAREEAENLRRNLEAVLEQDYPLFEVVVINDGNTDESEDFLILLSEKYPNLYHSFVPDTSRYISRKKLSITLGVKASKYDWLVFTEANCMPSSNQWLRTIARNFTSQTQIVLGYSGYERGKGWLHKKAAFDNLFFSMRYLGYALAGHPYIGIGRNMAYRKELFYEQKGFSAHLNLQRGDDDLFINKVTNSENTRVETDQDAIVRIKPVSRYKDWQEEKMNYTATAQYYRGGQRYISGFETTTRLFFHLSWLSIAVVGVINKHWLVAGLAVLLFLLRFTLQLVVINKTAKDLSENRRYYFSLILFDFIQPIQSLQWKLYCTFRKGGSILRNKNYS